MTSTLGLSYKLDGADRLGQPYCIARLETGMGLSWSSTGSDEEYSDTSDVEAGPAQSVPPRAMEAQVISLEQASALFTQLVQDNKINRDVLLSEVPDKEVSQFDLDAHVEMAKTLLKISPLVNEWRFKLVPGRIKEQKFWCALFYQLKRANHGRIPSFLANAREGSTASTTTSSSSSPATVRRGDRQTSLHTSDLLDSEISKATGDPKLQQHVEELYQVIRTQDAELAALRQRVAGQTHCVCDRCGNILAAGNVETQRKRHKGEWMLDKDSKEFLGLEKHLQENLRSEKLKRLKEVREQMRWILEGNDVSHGNGEWSCCKQKAFFAPGECN